MPKSPFQHLNLMGSSYFGPKMSFFSKNHKYFVNKLDINTTKCFFQVKNGYLSSKSGYFRSKNGYFRSKRGYFRLKMDILGQKVDIFGRKWIFQVKMDVWLLFLAKIEFFSRKP